MIYQKTKHYNKVIIIAMICSYVNDFKLPWLNKSYSNYQSSMCKLHKFTCSFNRQNYIL